MLEVSLNQLNGEQSETSLLSLHDTRDDRA